MEQSKFEKFQNLHSFKAKPMFYAYVDRLIFNLHFGWEECVRYINAHIT
jgi:hypothetical protein